MEDHYEKLSLLEKTKAIEDRQNERAARQNAAFQERRENERVADLMTGLYTMDSVHTQEEAQRKSLVHEMNVNTNEKTIVKVLTNLQGK